MWGKTFSTSSLLHYCCSKGDEYHTATAFYLTTLFKNGMGLTQAAVHQEENNQSRKTVDANEQISDHYYQSVDSKESDHLNQVNESIFDTACDNVGDLAICDDVERMMHLQVLNKNLKVTLVCLIIIQVLMNIFLLKIRQRICKMNKNYQVNELIIMR